MANTSKAPSPTSSRTRLLAWLSPLAVPTIARVESAREVSVTLRIFSAVPTE